MKHFGSLNWLKIYTVSANKLFIIILKEVTNNIMSQEELKTSIIIPAYNSQDFLERSLRSCISQSENLDTFEIVVVNDGSEDSTQKVCNIWSDSIVYLEHENNRGLPSALNTGIIAAKGKYIVRLDADDFLHRDFIKFSSLYLDLNHEIQMVEFDYYIINEKGERTRKNAKEEPIGCSNIIRKDYLVSIGLYNEEFKLAEEIEIKTRLNRSLIAHVPLPLYRYYKHNDNMTKSEELYNSYKNKIKNEHK